MAGGVEPVVQGVLSGVLRGNAGKHSQIYAEAIGIAAGQGRLAFLLGVVPGVLLIGNGLGGAHQGLTDRQFRHTVLPAHLIDQPYQLQPHIQRLSLVGATLDGGSLRSMGANGQRQGGGFPGLVGDGDLRAPFRFGNGCPEVHHLFHLHRVRVAGSHGVRRPAGTNHQAAVLSHLQRGALVAAYPDGLILRRPRGESQGSGQGCAGKDCGKAFQTVFHHGMTSS